MIVRVQYVYTTCMQYAFKKYALRNRERKYLRATSTGLVDRDTQLDQYEGSCT